MIPLADYKERIQRVDGILFACNEKQAERHKITECSVHYKEDCYVKEKAQVQLYFKWVSNLYKVIQFINK